MSRIGLVEVSAGVASLPSGAGSRLAGMSASMLRFRLSASDQEAFEALRNARRSLLREEWTRGREPGEPSLGDAVFSSTQIVWIVRPEQRPWCLQKLEELLRRANLFLRETGAQ